ncbi:MAG: hypothetical protein IT381_00865 [Deltaproteobacteria bacterium]|nr:hypothetical protein [Deltaproteobacteria bacterium]
MKLALLLVLCACGSATPRAAAGTSADALVVGPCLESSGVKMYGAFWCPHCKAQMELFGDAFPSAIYVECSNADHSQNDVCRAEDIAGYPTWIFADGARLVGEQTLATLKDKAGCP